jgi:hypothetical protein
MKATLKIRAGIGLAAAAAAGVVGLASPAADAATAAQPSPVASGTSTESSAYACFIALSNADEDLQIAGYFLTESQPWQTYVQQAQAGMTDPVCAPYTALIQGPMTQAEPLIAQAESQAQAGELSTAANTFLAAANAFNPAWEDVDALVP